MSQEIPFDPFPFISDPHRQTILSGMYTFFTDPESETQVVRLPDGDKVAMEVSTPREWRSTDPTVILVHGLCGSHRSPYLVRLIKRLQPLGIRGIRFNMRGCGSGQGLARHMYHSGRSDDLFEAIKWLKKENPESPIILIGFSLGGNQSLKLAGELGSLGPRFIKGVIAVSPPIDLFESVKMICNPGGEIYERYFVRMLTADVQYRHERFPELPPADLPRDLTVMEFDSLYTAARFGFNDAVDYYNKCSSRHVIPEIKIPTRILLAEDDPIVSPHTIDAIALPPSVEIFKTKKGGHMGYLGNPFSKKGFYWLDSLLIEWIQSF